MHGENKTTLKSPELGNKPATFLLRDLQDALPTFLTKTLKQKLHNNTHTNSRKDELTCALDVNKLKTCFVNKISGCITTCGAVSQTTRMCNSFVPLKTEQLTPNTGN